MYFDSNLHAYSFINKHSDKWIPIPGSPGRIIILEYPILNGISLYEVISTEEINEPDPGIFKDTIFYISCFIRKRSILC